VDPARHPRPTGRVRHRPPGPVGDGLVDLDPERGTTLRTLPVPRADPAAEVRIAAAGEVLLEQRGPEVVGLLPTR
jgi:hypothetical protein